MRWYGLMYLLGFVAFVVLGKYRARQNLLTGWHPRDVDDMLFYGVFGVILGGRLGYVLFYKFGYYAAHPLEVLALWQGGMSFHGGFLGVLIALARVRAHPAQALARRHGLRRAADSDRTCVRPARQFHQWRIVGTPDHRAVGDGVSPGRCAAAASVATLRVGTRGPAAVCGAVDLCPAQTSDGRGIRAVPDRLRQLSLHRRVRARARQFSRLARDGTVDGAVVVAADDRRRHLDDGRGRTGAPGRRSRRSMASKPSAA